MYQILNSRKNLLNLIVQLYLEQKAGSWASSGSFFKYVNVAIMWDGFN